MMQNEEGYTLTELMVAIIVGSLVVSFTYSLFTFTERMAVSWKHKVELQSMADRAVQQIAGDIEHSKDCVEQTDSTLMLEQDLQKKLQYTFRPTMILRNGNLMGNETDAALSMTVRKVEKEFVINVHAQSGSLVYDLERSAHLLESGKELFNSSQTTPDGSSK